MIAPLYCCSDYNVDSDGFIISKRNNKPMRPSKTKKGYLVTTIMVGGKRISIQIHAAVAKTFLGDRSSDGLQINHKDGNKENNSIDNLEWVSPQDNMRHAADVLRCFDDIAKRLSKPINGYDKLTGDHKYYFESISDGARFFCDEGKDYRCIKTSLWRALSGSRKSYKRCIWKYAD